MLKVTYLQKTFEIDDSKISDAMRHGLMEQGFRSMVQRKNASNADMSNDNKKAQVDDVVTALVKGVYSFGGGGGGKATNPLAKEVKRLLVAQLVRCEVPAKVRKDYDLESWALKFCEEPDDAVKSILEQAAANVKRDAAFVVKSNKPAIELDPTVADKDLEEEE